jgi:hypothetical protein
MMIPPIKRGTARRLGLRLPSAYRPRVMLGFDAASNPNDFFPAATVLRRCRMQASWTPTRHDRPLVAV